MSLKTQHLVAVATSTAFSLSAYWFYQRFQQRRNKASVRRNVGIPVELFSCPYANELQLAVTLALQCGSNMYRYCNEKGTLAENDHHLTISTKGQPEDFSTKIDIENENLILTRLRKHYPDHDIIGEESVGMGEIPRINNKKPTWIIDPIDGTTNFAAGLPLTCVSIGLCINGRPLLGVVYAPMTDELYLGLKGYGAYRNGVQITKRNCPNKKIKDSVVGFEFGYTRDEAGISKMIGAVQKIMINGCRTIRSLGSGVLDLIYVATGRIDVVYAGLASEGWKPWDYCAAIVIAEEAGCSVQSFKQSEEEDFDIYSTTVICAVNTSLVNELRHLFL